MRRTNQKEAVYNAIINSCDHPDVETIYLRSKKILPSISLATVYRAVSTLSNEGKVLKIPLNCGDRYDKTLNTHAHFHCQKCNSVTDVFSLDLSSAIINVENERAIKVESLSAIFSGICENCKNF